MKLTEMLKELNIGKWSACWAFISDGWAGIARLVCEAFTKLLRRKDPDKLRGYAEFVGKVAVYVGGGVETFCTDDTTKAAGAATANAVSVLAEHLEDGEYTTDELESDIKNIASAVDAWKAVADEEEDCPSCQD